LARRIVLILISTGLALVLVAWGVLSSFAARPLSIRELGIFTAAIVRAVPAHLGGGTLLQTLRLGGAAFGSPAEVALIPDNGREHAVPLPPRSTLLEASMHPHRYVTFATPDELRAWLHSSLSNGGWSHREQLGSMHVLDGDGAVLSVMMKFHAGTRIRELGLSVHRRSESDDARS
jgi:hypothetical protein